MPRMTVEALTATTLLAGSLALHRGVGDVSSFFAT